MKETYSRYLVFLVSVLLVLSIVSATDLQNIESITPQGTQDIFVNGSLNLDNNHPILNPTQVDGIDLDNPGNGITINTNQYAVGSGSIALDELNTGSVDGRYVNRGGDTMNGNLDMNGNNINGISNLDGGGNINVNGNNIVFSSNGDWIGDSGGAQFEFESGGVEIQNSPAMSFGDGPPSSGLDMGGYNIQDSSGTLTLSSATSITGNLNLNGNAIQNADWSNANDLNSGGTVVDFSNANDLDGSGNLVSGSVSDNEIVDNTVDNSEIQNGDRFVMNGVTLNGEFRSQGNNLNLDSGDQYITIHDGNGNFNIKSGVDPSNTIVAGTGGTHIRLDESGGFDVSVDESTGTGNSMGEDLGFTVNGGAVDINGGSLDLNSNNINSIGGLQNCGSNEFINGNGNCETDTNTDTDNQNLQDVLSQGNSAGSYSIDMNNNNVNSVSTINNGGSTVNTGGTVDVGSGSITSGQRMCIGDRCA